MTYTPASLRAVDERNGKMQKVEGMKANGSQVYAVGAKLYAICPQCGKLVRLNKPILGSVHFCGGDE